jgi:hypothetical protein
MRRRCASVCGIGWVFLFQERPARDSRQSERPPRDAQRRRGLGFVGFEVLVFGGRVDWRHSWQDGLGIEFSIGREQHASGGVQQCRRREDDPIEELANLRYKREPVVICFAFRIELGCEREPEGADEPQHVGLSGRFGKAREVALHAQHLVGPVRPVVVFGIVIERQQAGLPQQPLAEGDLNSPPIVFRAGHLQPGRQPAEHDEHPARVDLAREDIDGFCSHKANLVR